MGEEFSNVFIFSLQHFTADYLAVVLKKKHSKVYTEIYVCMRTVEELMCLMMMKFATDFRLCTVATSVFESTGGERPQSAKILFSLLLKKKKKLVLAIYFKRMVLCF